MIHRLTNFSAKTDNTSSYEINIHLSGSYNLATLLTINFQDKYLTYKITILRYKVRFMF